MVVVEWWSRGEGRGLWWWWSGGVGGEVYGGGEVVE